MENQETKFKVGDTVWSLTKGEGRVISHNYYDGVIIAVQFSNGDTYYYCQDGKYYFNDLFPEIYHTKPEVTIPKRKVKREVVSWIYKPEEVNHSRPAGSPNDFKWCTITWEEEID